MERFDGVRGSEAVTPGCIIIVSRNNLHLTKKAVRSALAQDTDCRVLLIDNASTDGTMQWAHALPNYATVHWHEQRSLSYCWNMALRAFFKRGAEQVLVCNNDIELRPDTYSGLRDALRDLSHDNKQNVGIISAVSVDSADRLYPRRGDTVCELPQTRRPHPDFSCFMLTRACYETVGSFDESYTPAYCEDCDYHVRMHRAGISALCVDLPFLHHGAGTLKHADPAEKVKIERGAQMNRERFRAKYGCLPGTPEYGELFR